MQIQIATTIFLTHFVDIESQIPITKEMFELDWCAISQLGTMTVFLVVSVVLLLNDSSLFVLFNIVNSNLNFLFDGA